MTRRALLLILCAAVLLLCALSTQGALFWLLFWVLGMMLLVGLASVLWTRFTLEVTCHLDRRQATRGEKVSLAIDIVHRCPLPVAPLKLELSAASDAATFYIYAPVRPFVLNMTRYGLKCPHVGAFPSGVRHALIRDVYGLFQLRRRVGAAGEELVVLPQLRAMQPLAFSPGESDNESMMARAFADATMPTDIRAFQQGDELKKVHWKLSMRRKELLVRVYEQPQRPDALLLIDCSPPGDGGRDREQLRDAICEAAASLAQTALSASAPVRMPLLAETPVDINASRAEDIEIVRTALARCPFDGSMEFERVLLLETRRMRRTGSTAVVTSRMNPVLADMILRMRRMGPKVRVLLVAMAKEEQTAQLLKRLVRNDVEVETIPAVDRPAEQPEMPVA